MTKPDERPESATPSGVHDVARRIGSVIRQSIGAPNYDVYLAHVREHQPKPHADEREYVPARTSQRLILETRQPRLLDTTACGVNCRPQ